MKHAVSICLLALISLTIGCDKSGGTKAPAESVQTGWQPKPEHVGRLDSARSILAGKGTLRPPKGFAFEEQIVVSAPVAVFKNEPNRVEIVMTNGLSASVTCEKFAGTTQQLHGSVSELENVAVDDVELGDINGTPAARFRYHGTTNGQNIEGVYYIWRPHSSGPIWNLVAEGTPEQLPVLEASLLTFREE